MQKAAQDYFDKTGERIPESIRRIARNAAALDHEPDPLGHLH